jgi:hypothetical protein
MSAPLSGQLISTRWKGTKKYGHFLVTKFGFTPVPVSTNNYGLSSVATVLAFHSITIILAQIIFILILP